jgi:hypothetical protein
LQARILEHTQRQPRDGSTHWSTRKLAKELGLAQSHAGGAGLEKRWIAAAPTAPLYAE